jgi:hypothetical protein
MKPNSPAHTLTALLACSLAACSPQPDTQTANIQVALIGPRGGAIQGPNGSELLVPAGAFPTPTPVAIVLPPVGSTPALPAYMTAVGATYDVLPHETQFASFATVSIPFDPNQVPTALAPLLLRASGGPDAEWRSVTAAQAISGARMQAPLRSAGAFVVVVPSIPPTQGD